MTTIKELSESLPEAAVNAIAASFAAPHLIAAKAKAEKEAAMKHLTAAVRTEDLEAATSGPVTLTRLGTERDYLLHRLNERHQHGKDPGVADYVGVRKTGAWEVEASVDGRFVGKWSKESGFEVWK